ncbi:MAG: protein BatD, partial [Planctomycetes bacterium]|nr:protein BatD [Planctomycetota bacterium]
MNPDRRFVPVALALLLACGAAARAAQPTFFEPKEHYYGAKSYGFGENGVRWELAKTSVEAGGELTVTLVIGGAQYPVLNPTEITKPDLSKLPAFADPFAVGDAPDPPRKAGDKQVRFAYALRPRNRAVAQVPALEFYYFNPRAPANKSQFRHTQAEAVSITVTDPPAPRAVPLMEPDRLFVVATGADALRAPFVPCRWAWAAAGAFGPLAAGAWLLVWRRAY